MAHSQKKVTDTIPKERHTGITRKTFKSTVLNMFKESRRPQIKMYRQQGEKMYENIQNKEKEILTENQSCGAEQFDN